MERVWAKVKRNRKEEKKVRTKEKENKRKREKNNGSKRKGPRLDRKLALFSLALKFASA
jgi:hypothetical protein